MAIKLILTKEQFAAIQFCGSELSIENGEKQLKSDIVEKKHPAIKFTSANKNQEE